MQSSTLKLWTNTRWDSRWVAIGAIIRNYPAIVKSLEDLAEEDSGARSTNAGGLLMHVKKSIFIITSFILHQLFGSMKILSDFLKSIAYDSTLYLENRDNSFFMIGSSLDYVRGEYLIKSIIQQLKDLRNEQSFHEIYDKAKRLCDENNIDLLQLYRSRRETSVSTRFRDCLIESTLGHRETISTSSDYLNRLFSLSLIVCSLNWMTDFHPKPYHWWKAFPRFIPRVKISWTVKLLKTSVVILVSNQML